ncbi:phospholipid phosphatase-related protein type 4-like [Astyanax mexicanus]|uniref:Phospholipid phosphatase-related protein type 4 n=1 Tax=Astyanax mexicanus TaxID=7994 RepID=A0A8T2KZM7_ASTMX|nr:phospholipid phosphatase-related protein type 4-like [Astyanax mexicanus]
MAAKERLKSKMSKDSVTLLPCFYFVELPILASSVVSLYFLELTDIFKPVHSGYSCNDRTLSMPYIEPNKEVIPFLMLFSLAFAGPAATIMIGEGILYCCLARRNLAIKTEANINAAGCNFNSYIRRAVRFVGVHIFGLCITALITDIIQLSTGYHAPYFLTVCKPNYTTLNTTCDENAFIVDDICSGSDPTAINAGRKSFPSQHATLAAFAAVYISMYFNATLTDSSKLLKPLLVFSFIMCGVICGLTRIIQFKNHAIDVYCGFLIGGGIAIYLGLYAVGNFKPSEDTSLHQHHHNHHHPLHHLRPPQPHQPQPPPMQLPAQPQPIMPPPALREPLRTLPNLTTDHPRLLQAKSYSVRERPTSARSESILLRGPQRHSDSLTSLKRASTEVECITPPSPICKESLVTFSNTLPRVHSTASLQTELPYSQNYQNGYQVNKPFPQAPEEPISRRHAAIHSSMDSTRSKQLLSQWKSKNENRKLSLQAMEVEADPGRSPQRSMELRCSSEPAAMGMEMGGPASQYMKLAASSVPLPNHNHNGGGGMVGGARVSMQSRPGSSQLVHIPEETQENACSSPQDDSGEASDGGGGNSARSKWMKVAEKSTVCRTNSQPRIMQVIAMSKQQGMLHGSPKSESSTLSCTGSIRYKALMDQEPNAGIVHVEAHPESRPMVKMEGGGSWRWKPPQERGSIRQSFELNDLNRDSESCDSLKDGYGSVDGKQSLPDMSNPSLHHPHFHHHHHPHAHPQAITTIRVTPVETSSEAASETLSIASSRDSTLQRRKNNSVSVNVSMLPDRGPSPDNTRNLPHFFKHSPTPPPTVTFKE